MKLLVTGGAGFIGSCFVRMALLERWAEQVINFDKLTYAGNLENLHAGRRATRATALCKPTYATRGP